jgi:hypothetical protein
MKKSPESLVGTRRLSFLLLGGAFLFFERLALLDLVGQDLNHAFATDLLESLPESNQLLDIHHVQDFSEGILPVFALWNFMLAHTDAECPSIQA